MRILLKVLILTTLVLSLLGALIPTLYAFLAFSWNGVQHLFLWQFITYLFVEQGPLSFPFFLNLAFNLYLLWIFGSQLMERAHPRLFLTLYLGAGLLGAAAALAVPHPLLSGSTNGVYAILIAWMLLNQGSVLRLFFAFNFASQWLILALVGAALLLDLTNDDWAGALSLAVSCLYAYLFFLITWRQPGPFFFLRRFEKSLFRFLEKKKTHTPYNHSKIYDIKSGEPVLDDDQFMDAMLDRISRHGEESLTPQEKKRMREISKRKK